MFAKRSFSSERRNRERRGFPHYVQFRNDLTGELVGNLADLSLDGFRLEGSRHVPNNTLLQFRVDLPPEVPGRTSIVVRAQSRWIQPHPVDTRLYVTGYEIRNLDAADGRALKYVFDKFGSTGPATAAGHEYVWKD
jgi:hypothetical protein